jgi:uncharacterized protein YjbJ (UPF0337 family)
MNPGALGNPSYVMDAMPRRHPMSLSDNVKHLTDKVSGKAKEKAGEVFDDDSLRKQGEAQQNKAEAAEDAERLEELAREKQQEAAGYKGQEKAQAQKD